MTQLPDFVNALLKPDAYTERPETIDLIQTQMSFVFVTPEFAYKIKKPVNLGYLDYTSLEKRRFFCQKELQLNRRLCPETYLGVMAITKYQGVISFGWQGEIIEYAVKMRHLPQNAMLDVLLKNDRVSKEMVQQIAQKLAAFHERAATNAEISKFGSLEAVKINTEENFSQTERYIGNTITESQYNNIKRNTDNFMLSHTELFNQRIESGNIKDCHGDLHAAHICFTNGICIYDCIEFNDRFRYSDTASEIAFLAMDIDRYGYSGLSQYFVDAYVEFSKDETLRNSLNFYKCYRAYVRGKVESFKLDDPLIEDSDKAETLLAARRYFELAESYLINEE